jgi:hypothetical protein
MFFGRSAYRRRRMADAAALLPVLGAFMMILPLLWAGNTAEGALGARTSAVMIYLFGVWAGLSVLSAFVSRYLHADPSERGADDGTTDAGVPMASDPAPEPSRAPARGPTGTN